MLSIRAPFKRTPEVSDASAEGAVDDSETKVERLRRELAAAELAERRKINRLRRDLADAEAKEKSAVSSETSAPRPGKAGLLTVAQLVDLGLILEESVRRNRELPQKELAKLLGYKNPQGLNNHIGRLEAKLDGLLFVPNETNRSGRLTFEGWEFGMIGILLRDLVELDGAVPQRVYEKVLRELVYRLRWSKMEALDNVDPDEDLNAPRLSGLAAMAVGVKGFHWLETIVPVEPETKYPLPEVPKPLLRPKPSSSVSVRKDPSSRDRR